MRYCILFLLLFIPWPALAQNAAPVQATVQNKPILIREISIEGFVLGDKDRFVKLFKPYRNKYLTTADMDDVLQKIQIMYEKEGYQELVSISYQVIKHRLIFTVSMTS